MPEYTQEVAIPIERWYWYKVAWYEASYLIIVDGIKTMTI